MKRIRLLVTSDVHGYVYPYSYADGKKENIGFAKVKAVMDSLKDENTLLLDNGDVLEGSPLSFYHFHSHSKNISPMSKAMRLIGYDYVNVGNHDFNYGEEALLQHLDTIGAPCITTNWKYKNHSHSYVIREFDGTRIALFGLVTDYIPHWESKEHIKESAFEDAIQKASSIVHEIRTHENVDYVICMYHGGFEKSLETGEATEDLTGENVAYELLQQVKEIDVLLSGHQHRSLCGKLFNTVYTQTRDKGCEVGCVDIYPEENRITSRVIPCELEADFSLLASVQDEENACQSWLDQTLGTANVDLSIHDEADARLHKAQLITFLNHVVMEATNADIACNPLFLHATGFQHEITMRNLVSTYVYPNTIVVKKISGKVLKAYLEQDAEFFSVKEDGTICVSEKFEKPKPQHYNYDMLDGIEYTIKVSNPIGHRIISLTKDGEPIKDDDVFTIAMNNYRASGGGDYEMLKNAETVKEISAGMVDLLAEYIMKYKVIDFKSVDNIHVIL